MLLFLTPMFLYLTHTPKKKKKTLCFKEIQGKQPRLSMDRLDAHEKNWKANYPHVVSNKFLLREEGNADRPNVPLGVLTSDYPFYFWVGFALDPPS